MNVTTLRGFVFAAPPSENASPDFTCEHARTLPAATRDPAVEVQAVAPGSFLDIRWKRGRRRRVFGPKM